MILLADLPVFWSIDGKKDDLVRICLVVLEVFDKLVPVLLERPAVHAPLHVKVYHKVGFRVVFYLRLEVIHRFNLMSLQLLPPIKVLRYSQRNAQR